MRNEPQRRALPRLRVSDNGRFLVTKDGAPFFWQGDTAWELFHRLTHEEAAGYLANRRDKGFNVVQAVALAELDGLHTPNANGDTPLHDNDPTRPNERYFQFMDEIIDLAAENGIYVALLPTWGDKVTPLWGIGPAIFDEANAAVYGRWLGERYRDRTNVVWVLGGDRPPTTVDADYRAIWRAMAGGVRQGAGDEIVMTFHPMGQRGSSEAFHADAWLDMNMWQSGHLRRDEPNWEWIGEDYRRAPAKPVIDGEPNYEDHPIDPFTRNWRPEYGYFDDADVRRQAYRAVFAGACGHTYGHHAIWQFYEPGRAPINHPYCPWQEALDRPGAGQMIHLRRLMESRPYTSRIPDQNLLLSDDGEGGEHARATRDEHGSYAFVYLPTAREIALRLDVLSGATVRGWWFEPASGAASEIGSFPSSGEARFVPPGPGDWVLVLDDEARGFGPPGESRA